MSAPTPPAWVPPGPIAQAPYPTPDPDARLLLDALAGVELGAYDRQSADHLAWFVDRATFAVLVSWLWRVRRVH